MVDRVALGVLTRSVPAGLVDEVVAECGRRERRRRKLPARLVVYYVLAMCLFPRAGYEEVARLLVEGLPGWVRWRVPNKSSISRARARLGAEVVRRLFARVAGPVAGPGTPGALWRGLRVMAVDGTVLEVPDSPGNAEAFGGQTGAGGVRVGYPQVRVVTLAECGTHAIADAEVGAYTEGEPGLVRRLARATGAGMLVLADRGLLGVALWRAFTATGAHLLVRARHQVANKIISVLPDGSYLARLSPCHKSAHWGGSPPGPVTVRIIEYTVDGGEVIRLATSLLDPQAAPAAELASLYHQRWEIESAYREFKTYQRGAGLVLRSRDPEGVRQEVWAHLVVYQAIRDLICHAAPGAAHGDPDRLSFTRALNIVRRSIPAQAGLSPLPPGPSGPPGLR
nr:IS4 family transposase [Carbonactinospora thermoautotrophica]